MALLEATGLQKIYPGVRALAGVDFAVEAGEIHALVGENGAGKSTLIKVITGAVTPELGSLRFDGRPLVGHDPQSAKALGIAAMYQQPALFPTLTVTENLSLGSESPKLWRRVDWRARRRRAAELLAQVDATIDPDRQVSSLSMPEQQWVEIARALGSQARLLILDEPTACLPSEQVHQLFALLRRLRADGLGIVYISHRLEEVADLADRVTVLRDGASVASGPIAEMTRGRLISLMVGRELSDLYPVRTNPLSPEAPVLLTAERLAAPSCGLHEASFSLRAGEILGLAGLVGSGRTELARVLFGLQPMESGTLHRHGASLPLRSVSDAISAGLAYVPEDRRQHGIVGELSNVANTTLAVLQPLSKGGLVDDNAAMKLTAKLLERLDVRTPSIFTATGNLSGGNQQKVAVARWLAASPEVIIVDEPTQGVDIGAKAEIHQILIDLADQGCGVLLISSELNEVLGLADRVGVMRDGRLVEVLNRTEAAPERVLALALGQTEAAA